MRYPRCTAAISDRCAPSAVRPVVLTFQTLAGPRWVEEHDEPSQHHWLDRPVLFLPKFAMSRTLRASSPRAVRLDCVI